MDRRIEEIRAAAKRHSPDWWEIIELADDCCMAATETGSYEAFVADYLLKSGMEITGQDATGLVWILQCELMAEPNVDAEDVWKYLDSDLDGILNGFSAAANA